MCRSAHRWQCGDWNTVRCGRLVEFVLFRHTGTRTLVFAGCNVLLTHWTVSWTTPPPAFGWFSSYAYYVYTVLTAPRVHRQLYEHSEPDRSRSTPTVLHRRAYTCLPPAVFGGSYRFWVTQLITLRFTGWFCTPAHPTVLPTLWPTALSCPADTTFRFFRPTQPTHAHHYPLRLYGDTFFTGYWHFYLNWVRHGKFYPATLVDLPDGCSHTKAHLTPFGPLPPHACYPSPLHTAPAPPPPPRLSRT